MSWSKKQLIEQAFDEAGLASYIFDLTPNQLQSALRKLDSQMATWLAKGINLGYPTPSTPSASDIDADSNIPDWANEATYLNLSKKIAPSFGKTLSLDTKTSAKFAYDAMIILVSPNINRELKNTTPLGAGNKPWRWNNDPFVRNSKSSY